MSCNKLKSKDLKKTNQTPNNELNPIVKLL